MISKRLSQIRLIIVRSWDLPFFILLEKGWHTLLRRIRDRDRERHALKYGSYSDHRRFEGEAPMRLLAKAPPRDVITTDFPFLTEFNSRCLQHRFDLLGSGWTTVASPAATIETRLNKSNLKRALEIQALLSPEYAALDWQLDFKSQYRFSERHWGFRVPIGRRPGVDVKVPWEMGRMHHLTALALEVVLANDLQTDRQTALIAEIQNQILDFIAQNPPGFGVQWRCAMDVGIRAANWTLAIALVQSTGHEFSAHFNAIFLASLIDHGNFIFANLEKEPDFRGNHYLANLAGLSFIAAALPNKAPEKSRWLDWVYREWIVEVSHQFNADGSNFEGSTSYHRLSSELAVWSFAALIGQGKTNWPSSVLSRLRKTTEFTATATKPSQQLVQIGDTDSGRLFKIPFRLDTSIAENHLRAVDTIAATDALFGETNETSLSAIVLQSLTGNIVLNFKVVEAASSRIMNSSLEELIEEWGSVPESHRSEFKIELSKSELFDRSALRWSHFQDFGLIVLRNSNFYLSFRCGPIGQNGRGGHDHVDQLSIEIERGGKTDSVVADPGTYLYTSDVASRNRYRSRSAHFAPQFRSGEYADLDAGTFYLRKLAPGEIRLLGAEAVAGRIQTSRGDLNRLIVLEEDGIRVLDWSQVASIVDLNSWKPLPYSPGYGLKCTGGKFD